MMWRKFARGRMKEKLLRVLAVVLFVFLVVSARFWLIQ
jgi:hypothetical protein